MDRNNQMNWSFPLSTRPEEGITLNHHNLQNSWTEETPSRPWRESSPVVVNLSSNFHLEQIKFSIIGGEKDAFPWIPSHQADL